MNGFGRVGYLADEEEVSPVMDFKLGLQFELPLLELSLCGFKNEDELSRRLPYHRCIDKNAVKLSLLQDIILDAYLHFTLYSYFTSILHIACGGVV